MRLHHLASLRSRTTRRWIPPCELSTQRLSASARFRRLRVIVPLVALLISSVAFHADALAAGGSMTSGGNYTGTVLRGQIDQWTFSATQGEYVLITVSVVGAVGDQTFVPFIQVQAPDGTLAASTYHGAFARVDFTAAQTGTYTARVSRAGGAPNGGQYVIALAQAPAPFVVPADDEGGPMTDGGTFTGSVFRGDLDLWSFTAAKDDAVTLTASVVGPVSDGSLVPHVQIFAPDGTSVADTYHGGVARADFSAPQSGTYEVIVSRAGFTSSSGQYSLNLAGTAATGAAQPTTPPQPTPTPQPSQPSPPQPVVPTPTATSPAVAVSPPAPVDTQPGPGDASPNAPPPPSQPTPPPAPANTSPNPSQPAPAPAAASTGGSASLSVQVVQKADGSLLLVQGPAAWVLFPIQVGDADIGNISVGDVLHGFLVIALPGPAQVDQGPDATLYLVQGQQASMLVPDQISDAAAAGFTLVGEVDGTLPEQLLPSDVPSPAAQPAPPLPEPVATEPSPPPDPAPPSAPQTDLLRADVLAAIDRANAVWATATQSLDPSGLSAGVAGRELNNDLAELNTLRQHAQTRRNINTAFSVTDMSLDSATHVTVHTQETWYAEIMDAPSGRLLQRTPAQNYRETYTVELLNGAWMVTEDDL
jgi:hypothetical protein